MPARPSRTRNEVALREVHQRLKDIDLAIHSLEMLEQYGKGGRL